MILLLVCGLVLFFSDEVYSLKSVVIRVPEVAKSGDTVTLSCDYDLEQVALYSIKWYWNEEEFYRFVPKESPPFRAFAMKHVNVDISRSGPTQVTLLGVRRELSGDYKCEVSADAPLFHTDIKVSHMIVAELPNGNPVMNIEPSKVEIGKKIRAECFTPGSDPAANITWYLNDEEISGDNESVHIYPIEVQLDQALGLQSVKSRLEMVASRSNFVQGLITIKCEAEIFSLWQKSVEDFVRDSSPQSAPVLRSTSPHQSHSGEILIDVQSNCGSLGGGVVGFVNLLVVAIFLIR